MRLTKYFGWGLGLAGLIIAVWLLGRGQPEEPGQLTITSDYPAEVIVSQDTPRSLGTTPATLKIDQVGYWEIAGFEPIEGQRQLAYRLLRDRARSRRSVSGLPLAGVRPIPSRPTSVQSATPASTWRG